MEDRRSDIGATPLYKLHVMIDLYRGDLSRPHYIIVSHAYYNYMASFYAIQIESVRGMPIIKDHIEASTAYVYPISLYRQGHRPWHPSH
jgi:hypothetical protein